MLYGLDLGDQKKCFRKPLGVRLKRLREGVPDRRQAHDRPVRVGGRRHRGFFQTVAQFILQHHMKGNRVTPPVTGSQKPDHPDSIMGCFCAGKPGPLGYFELIGSQPCLSIILDTTRKIRLVLVDAHRRAGCQITLGGHRVKRLQVWNRSMRSRN